MIKYTVYIEDGSVSFNGKGKDQTDNFLIFEKENGVKVYFNISKIIFIEEGVVDEDN